MYSLVFQMHPSVSFSLGDLVHISSAWVWFWKPCCFCCSFWLYSVSSKTDLSSRVCFCPCHLLVTSPSGSSLLGRHTCHRTETQIAFEGGTCGNAGISKCKGHVTQICQHVTYSKTCVSQIRVKTKTNQPAFPESSLFKFCLCGELVTASQSWLYPFPFSV